MKRGIIAIVALGVALVSAPPAHAALSDTTNFSQDITAGVLSTFVGDTDGNDVTTPDVTFTSVAVSTSTQTSVGVYGTDAERIYVDNPSGADSGWSLSVAATDGVSAVWTNGSQEYAFNGVSAALGQLTIDPAAGTLTPVVGTASGLSLGSASTFSGGLNTPASLLVAGAGADDINSVYLTGVTTSQTIPAGQAPGSYAIDFTQTIAAI
jgi:hypothetical protein